MCHGQSEWRAISAVQSGVSVHENQHDIKARV